MKAENKSIQNMKKCYNHINKIKITNKYVILGLPNFHFMAENQ